MVTCYLLLPASVGKALFRRIYHVFAVRLRMPYELGIMHAPATLLLPPTAPRTPITLPGASFTSRRLRGIPSRVSVWFAVTSSCTQCRRYYELVRIGTDWNTNENGVVYPFQPRQ